MTLGRKALWTAVSLGCLLVIVGTVYSLGRKSLSLPFRTTNDALHLGISQQPPKIGFSDKLLGSAEHPSPDDFYH